MRRWSTWSFIGTPLFTRFPKSAPRHADLVVLQMNPFMVLILEDVLLAFKSVRYIATKFILLLHENFDHEKEHSSNGTLLLKKRNTHQKKHLSKGNATLIKMQMEHSSKGTLIIKRKWNSNPCKASISWAHRQLGPVSTSSGLIKWIVGLLKDLGSMPHAVVCLPSL